MRGEVSGAAKSPDRSIWARGSWHRHHRIDRPDRSRCRDRHRLFPGGEAVLTGWVIEHYFGADFRLGKLRNVLGLLAAAIIGTTASGIGGTLGFKLFHSPDAPLLTTWQQWFASDGLGIITVAPLLIE